MKPLRACCLAAHRPSILASLLLVALAACVSPGTPLPDAARVINATRQVGPDRFQPGDRISLRFAHDRELDQVVDVRPDGTATFLVVGEIPVAGKTAEELRHDLTTAYARSLTSPELVANLDTSPEFVGRESSRRFFVLGEVGQPGSFQYTGEAISIPKALSLARGFLKASASLESMLLVRWLPEQGGYHGWKINAAVEYWGASEQVLLQAGDVLYVPNTPIDKVNIWVDKYIRQLIPFPYLSYYVVNQPATP